MKREDKIIVPIDAIARTNAYYGQGSGSIHIDDIACTGTETRLIDCNYDSNTNDCSHSQDAGVQCVVTSEFRHKFGF